MPSSTESVRCCPVCRQSAAAADTAQVRCNVRRFRDRSFPVWRCAACGSLHGAKVDDLASYYADYPIRNQGLDYFTRAWYRVVLKRLVAAGLGKRDRILDYGCNQGLFLRFLEEQGYRGCSGYDPFVARYSSTAVLETTYDLVVSLDVIEHDDDPRAFLTRLVRLVAPGGRLCIETPNADGIVLGEAEEYLHALHAPYHIHILSQKALAKLSSDEGLAAVAVHNRWYMDSWLPGTARRLFEGLLKHAGNDLDAGYEPPRLGLFFKHPSLFIHLFLGYFLPGRKNDHMMMIFAKTT